MTSLFGWLVRFVAGLWRSTAGWFVWEKNTVPAENLRSFMTSHSQTNRLKAFQLTHGQQSPAGYRLRALEGVFVSYRSCLGHVGTAPPGTLAPPSLNKSCRKSCFFQWKTEELRLKLCLQNGIGSLPNKDSKRSCVWFSRLSTLKYLRARARVSRCSYQ